MSIVHSSCAVGRLARAARREERRRGAAAQLRPRRRARLPAAQHAGTHRRRLGARHKLYARDGLLGNQRLLLRSARGCERGEVGPEFSGTWHLSRKKKRTSAPARNFLTRASRWMAALLSLMAARSMRAAKVRCCCKVSAPLRSGLSKSQHFQTFFERGSGQIVHNIAQFRARAGLIALSIAVVRGPRRAIAGVARVAESLGGQGCWCQ